MSKSVFAALAVAALVAGCVSVTGPTASPGVTAAPTLAPTGAPTAPPTPTFAPTASPTVAPTAEPTASVTASPTEQPTGAPTGFDDRDVLFDDDLTDPTGQCTAPTGTSVPVGCFGVGEVTGGGDHIGNVAYVDGRLNFAVDLENGWMWSHREVDGAHSTMRIAAELILASHARAGLFCASGDDQLYGVVLDTEGWRFATIGETGAEVLLEDVDAGLDLHIGDSTLVALECAGLATGKLRLTLWLEDTGPVAIYEGDEGPDNFDRTAVYAETQLLPSDVSFEPTSVDLEEIVAFGSGFADNQITDAATDLMTHIPEDWVDSCYQSLRPPAFGSIAEAVVTCFIGEPGDDGAEIAEYASYLSPEAMNAAYQRRVDIFGAGEGAAATCEEGSAENGYHFGSDDNAPDAGRLMCADQFRGIRYDWTDDRLNILSTLSDFDGEFAKVWDNWQVGGPNP